MEYYAFGIYKTSCKGLGQKGDGSVVVVVVVVVSLLIVTPIGGFCNCFMFCCALLYVYSSFAIILMGKRELVALLGLSSWCLVMAVWLFLAVPWVCLWFVNVFLLIILTIFTCKLSKPSCRELTHDATKLLHGYFE